ncbi:MAG TPA: hydrolase 2, exosortase A system-associated, partial [Nitrosospira sp.]|nr:hydrolase 2, exosortase A system-associated [Nitrosospira sp.]
MLSEVLPRTLPAQPFFLETTTGKRFCLYHAPGADTQCLGVFIYIHPFGDEMNKSRRMAAMQARAFAKTGFGVLQIDLYGCGDSEGDFGDAKWDIWKNDLMFACNWIASRTQAPVNLWGLRIGALLALDFASEHEKVLGKIVLWQPVVDGASFLNQFLRLRIASEMFLNAGAPEMATGTKALRERLMNGESLEVAGYELSPHLAGAIEKCKAADLAVQTCAMHWFEIVAEPGRSISPAGTKVVNQWKLNGVNAQVHAVPGLP